MKELHTEIIYLLCLQGRMLQQSAILTPAIKLKMVCSQGKSHTSSLADAKFKEYLLKAPSLSNYAVLTSLS